ncbi:MAG TPA: TatD family hydrolase [Candidatus Paceibacterota bacterium]
MIFDSHCHPQMAQYDKDREDVISQALKEGVSMICVGTDLETSRQGIELAQKYENIWASVGLHPNDISEYFDISIYQSILENPKVVAVGEVGLDYYRTPELRKQEKQKEVFGQFINLALKHDKPLILHCRDSKAGSIGLAYKDMAEIIGNSALHGVVHSFTGSIEDVKKYLELGFHLGFNGIITFARQYDEMVREVPLNRILLETDAPFLTPEPYRGKRNEPAYVVEVAKKIAELKNEPYEKIVGQTTGNCKKLFGLL